MTVLCPNCGGRVRFEETEVVIEGGYRVTKRKGRCERCGSKYTVVVKAPLPRPDYVCGEPRTARVAVGG